MLDLHERSVVDRVGRRVQVILGIEEYDLRRTISKSWKRSGAYDAAKESPRDLIPLAEATAEIERSR